MTQISFGKKEGIVTSEATRSPIHGVEISHLGSKNVVFIQGTVMSADQLFKTGIGVGLPADPVYLEKVIKELDRLKDYLTSKHVR